MGRSFEYLLRLSKSEIIAIPAIEIIQCCIDALAKSEYRLDDIAKLILGAVLCPDNLSEAEVKGKVNPLLNILLENIHKHWNSFENSKENSILSDIMIVTIEFEANLTQVIAFADDNDPIVNCMIVEANLKLIEEHYSFLCKREQLSMASPDGSLLNELLTTSQTIQRSITAFIVDNVNLFVYSINANDQSVSRIFGCLCSIGEYVSQIDLKCTADIWKCVSHLATESSHYVKETNQEIPWLEKAVKFLCHEIDQSVGIILETFDEEDQQAIGKITRILKLSAFYLKIVLKLATDFGFGNFQGFQCVLDLGMLLRSLLIRDDVKPHLKQQLDEYLITGVNSLIFVIYESPTFAKCLLSVDAIGSDQFRGFLAMSMTILEHIIKMGNMTVVNLYFPKDSDNVLDVIFRMVLADPGLVLSSRVYEHLVTTMTAFILWTGNTMPDYVRYFETKLLNGLFGSNMIVALISCDIWCLLFRFLNKEVLREYLKYFLHCSFAHLFSHHPQTIFVKVLIQSLYKALPNQEKMVALQERYSDEENLIKLLSFVGLDNIPDESYVSQIIFNESERLQSNLQALMENSTPEVAKENYYALARNLQLLSTTKKLKDPMLEGRVREIFSLLKNSNQPHYLLWSLVVGYLISRSDSVVEILNILNEILHRKSSIRDSQMILYHVMRDLKNATKEVEHGVYQKFLEDGVFSDKILALLCSYYFRDCSLTNRERNETTNVPMMDSNFQNLGSCELVHSCQIRKDEDVENEIEIENVSQETSNPSKRLRVADDGDEEGGRLLIEAERNARKISEYFRTRQPDISEARQMLRIIDCYSDIVKGKIKN